VIVKSKIPFTLLDRTIDNLNCPGVSSDNRGGILEAMELLNRSGAERIGYLGGNVGISTAFDRYSGYMEGLKRLKLRYGDVFARVNLAYKPAAGFEGAKQLAQAGADAIIAGDNTLGIGAIQYLQSAKLRIPEDMALIVFDDYPWMDIATPPITRIWQDTGRMGSEAARILLKRMEDEEENEKLLLPTRLILGGSHLKTR
jgi:LacI family transcriptional regulator